MKFSELIEHATECIKTFNPIVCTIDSHSDTFLAKFKDPYEKVFIKQVFYGCIRYEDFLKIFIKNFFELNTTNTSRNDAAIYSVFAYLSFFRLDELQITDFRKLITSQEPVKMHTFLQFTFNAEILRQHLREPWMSLYDFTYIDDKVIGGIEKHLPAVADILRSVERRATGKVSSALSLTGSNLQDTDLRSQNSRMSGTQDGRPQSSVSGSDQEQFRQATVPQPFNLTKPKPKMIPVPDVIKREVVAMPIPKNMNKKSLADIEKDKLDRRLATVNAIRSEYETGPRQKFPLATEGLKSTQKNEEVKEFIEKQVTKDLNFKGNEPRPMPNFAKNKAEVKLTVAALKREKYIIDKEEAEEAKKLAGLEMGLKDASEFIRWQREMDKKEGIEKIEHVLKKKIEMEMSRQQAIVAKEQNHEDNHDLVSGMKEEMHKHLEKREQDLQEALLQRKDVIKLVHVQHDNAAQAKVDKQTANRDIRDQISKELEDAAKRLAEEKAAEQAKKEELIRQLRELEKIPIQRTKGFDPTEAGNHGLMCEMSVAELRERIELQKSMIEQENDFKREQNLSRKEREAATLIDDARKIEEARKKRKNVADQRRDQQKSDAKELEDARIAAREKGLKEAYDKISTKKKTKQQEDARLAKELKEIKLQRQYLNANAAMVEYKAWQELEKGKEREIRDRQNFKLLEQCGVNEIMVTDQLVRANNAKNEVTAKLTYDKGFNERLGTQKKENEVLHKRTLEYKSELHQKHKDFEDKLKENTLKRKPFDAKINDKTKTEANQYKLNQTAAAARNMYDSGMEDSPGAAEMDGASYGGGMMDDEGDNDIDAKMREEDFA